MKIYERVLALMVLPLLLMALIGVGCMEGGAGAWAGWLLGCALIGMVFVIVGVKVCWEHSAGEKARLFGERKELTYRQKLEQEDPALCHPRFIGGCSGCPGDYWEGAPECNYHCAVCDDDEWRRRCKACWDQKIG